MFHLVPIGEVRREEGETLGRRRRGMQVASAFSALRCCMLRLHSTWTLHLTAMKGNAVGQSQPHPSHIPLLGSKISLYLCPSFQFSALLIFVYYPPLPPIIWLVILSSVHLTSTTNSLTACYFAPVSLKTHHTVV
jgi:hypothetical protein